MQRISKMILLILCLTIMAVGPRLAGATAITLLPSSTNLFVGDIFDIGIMADIDPADAIVGFGFDVVTAGTGLAAGIGFTRGSGFAEDVFLSLVSDADGINGASGGDLLFGPLVSGNGILLGTLSVLALGPGDVTFNLTADDLGPGTFNSEGLITLTGNFMPQVTTASISIATSVPDASILILLGSSLMGLAVFSRKSKRTG